MGLIRDKDLFEKLENLEEGLSDLRKNETILKEILLCSMKNKLEVVESDKFETDIRKILNFGHTIGHGIESASKGKLLHGESVSIGMILALRL